MNMPTITQSLKKSLKGVFVIVLLFASSVSANTEARDDSADTFSHGELEQLLAPIALYPDTILSHILVAATYPLEVVQAERWTAANPDLKGTEAVESVEDKEWDPSVRALVAFPQILKRMSEDLEWTQQLGNAFLEDEEQLLASVQILRKLAAQAGSLDEMENVSVVRENKTIIIEPREREVVYVPYYDTRVVYGPWRWRHYEPIFWDYPYYDRRSHGSYYAHNRHSSFYWGPRVSLSFGFFFNTFHWQDRHLVRISSRHYRPHRYYGHSDILGHRYAERWVHNSGRRYGNRNRHIVNRDYRSNRYQNNGIRNGYQRGAGSYRQSRQERVRNQLATPGNVVVGRRGNPAQNPARQNTNTATQTNPADSNSARRNPIRLEQPIKNSRVVLSSRGRAVEDVRRPMRSGATQPNSNRQLERQRSNRVSQPTRRATPPRQAAVAPQQASRPANRQSAPQASTQSRPAQPRQSNSSPRVDKPRYGPKKAQSGSRRERGQLR